MVEKEKVIQLLKRLFVNRDDVYAEAFLTKPDSKKMSYGKQEKLLSDDLLLAHVLHTKTLGVYQLKGKDIIWACLDFDQNTVEDFENFKSLYNKLKEDGKHPLAELSGGGDYKVHIWLFCQTNASDVKYYLDEFCEKLKLRPHEIFPKQLEANDSLPYGNLVKLPLGLHLVTQKESTLLDDNFQPITNEDEIAKRLEYHTNNIDSFPHVKVIVKEIPKYENLQVEQDVKDFDEFFNFVKDNELPTGSSKQSPNPKIVSVYDNVMKNFAIYLVRSGFTDERIEAEIKPFYEKHGWVFRDLMGWVGRARKDFNVINIGELVNWCKVYKPELLELLPLDKVIPTKEISDKYINFVNTSGYNWSKLKNYSKNTMKERDELLFFATREDRIVGKPILLYSTLQKVILVNKVEKFEKDESKKNDTLKYTYKFIGENYDRRSEGFKVASLGIDLWIYKLISNYKEYVVFSGIQLGEEEVELSGMEIKLDEAVEISKKLELPTIRSAFFVESFKLSIDPISPKELTEYCRKNCITLDFIEKLLFLHPNGGIYEQPKDFTTLLLCTLLSSKVDGYPLHLLIIGPPGTGKTQLLECIKFKFPADREIFEAGNSTIKGLIPSFRESPANLGHILKCVRISLIDELLKKLDDMQKSQEDLFLSQFSQLNMILEQKRRVLGSGSGEGFVAKSTAKVIITTNPTRTAKSAQDHAFVLDRTTLSRLFIWGIDEKHSNFINEKKETWKKVEKDGFFEKYFLDHKKFGALKTHLLKNDSNLLTSNREKTDGENIIKNCSCNLYEYEYIKDSISDPFYVIIKSLLKIYDSCQLFLVDFNQERVTKIFKENLRGLKEPMKEIFKARGIHHLILLLDGIVKQRCLFTDYDDTFLVKDEDYLALDKLVKRIIETWSADLSQKDEINVIEGNITLEDYHG